MAKTNLSITEEDLTITFSDQSSFESTIRAVEPTLTVKIHQQPKIDFSVGKRAKYQVQLFL